MTTAIIADDEPHMRELLREHLDLLWPNLQIVGIADDGPSALAMIEAQRPDIAFLDVRMPGLTGIQVAYAITAPTRVVFVTAYDVHAAEAFKVNALDYVVKPVEATRLAAVVAKLKKATAESAGPDMSQHLEALSKLIASGAFPGIVAPPSPKSGLEWLQVSTGKQIRMLHIDDVMYFESDTKYTKVVADDFEGLIRLSLKQLTDQLSPELYLQIHRGTVVNRRYIHTVHRTGETVEVELKGTGARLKVSEPNYHLFRAM